MFFKVGDIVRYKGFHTEYEIVRVRSPHFVDIKITKLDLHYQTHTYPVGAVFPLTLTTKLEIIKAMRRHPLTTIFQ